MILAIPEQKKSRAIDMLQTLVNKKKATVKELQELCCYLNFLNRAVYPGRIFTRRMYAQYSSVVKMDSQATTEDLNEQNPGNKFKWRQYHHIKLSSEFKSDCRIWLQFLTHEGQCTIVNRLMIDLHHSVTATELFFYTDASAAQELSYGCVFDTKWTYGQWEQGFIKDCNPSIEYLELFALCAVFLTWQQDEKLKNNRVIIFCDNMAVVNMINKLSLDVKIACTFSEYSS